MSEEPIKKWGGARPGSGKKLKFNEPTTTVNFRVPVRVADEIRALVHKHLEKYQKP